MRTRALILATAAMAWAVGSVSAAEEFVALKNVTATPMTPQELHSVKGMLAHFLDANGGFHVAGNPNNPGVGTDNWYLNGSPDGRPVHPSYHGLCVSPLIIPTGGGPSQCP